MSEKRMVDNYEIINSIHIGDKEIVVGADMNNPDGLYYLVADCERNDIFERYTNALVSSDYLEIAAIYSDRLKEQISKMKNINKELPKGIVNADMCESISGKDIEGEIVAIKSEALRPEYRSESHQIVLCTGGNGAWHNARGSAVFCKYLYDDKSTRFERSDVLGILKKEHYPDWLNDKLKEQPIKVKKHKEVER